MTLYQASGHRSSRFQVAQLVLSAHHTGIGKETHLKPGSGHPDDGQVLLYHPVLSPSHLNTQIYSLSKHLVSTCSLQHFRKLSEIKADLYTFLALEFLMAPSLARAHCAHKGNTEDASGCLSIHCRKGSSAEVRRVPPEDTHGAPDVYVPASGHC